ncbi:restriction endonuclease subunit S [Mycobacterium attenuatum]|jgi:type I restriction enzyme S subunit|uniref:restriction endonuclease subunit S n=1 Tax=Mycobacterium attenuatum TaxID=2341086 RepID=UPI000F01CAAD|nr:restriction endonuclease subunit S [Mycobacterium attenuatum]
MKTGHTPSRSKPEYWENVTIPWFTLADVWQLRDGRRVYLGDTANQISELGLANSAAELLPAGTVVLSRTASVGFSGVMPRSMATSQDFWNWVCGPDLMPEYLNYQFKAIAPALRALNMGSTHQTIYQRDAAGIEIVVPPLAQQHAIAHYLDRETARIDTLIEEQQRLIEMLRQRRAGVIADAVTHGVDGGAAGSTQIGWLGPTPTHWRVGRVKHLGNVTLGKMLQASDSGSDVRAPYMRAANVQPDGELREDDVKEMWFSVDELASLDLRRGDVVVVEGGIGGYGRAAYLDHDLVGWGFQNSINRIRPHQETDGRYLAYFLIMARSMGFIEAYCNVVSMPHLTAEKLNSMPVPIPPLDEQQRIATYLDDQTSKIDVLIAETERFIELARERRAALITAAVTGQIDVSESAA